MDLSSLKKQESSSIPVIKHFLIWCKDSIPQDEIRKQLEKLGFEKIRYVMTYNQNHILQIKASDEIREQLNNLPFVNKVELEACGKV